jgi:hypothetical protein
MPSSKDLSDINFPIFTITPTYKRIWDEFNVKYIETASGIYILDNMNLSGKTLGERRLHIKSGLRYIPRTAYYNITQLIKSKNKTYIDNTGCVFTYKKTRNVPLKYYKVMDVVNMDEEGCILLIKGINFKLRTNCREAYDIKYIGLLITDTGYILYDTSNIQKKDTTRKI